MQQDWTSVIAKLKSLPAEMQRSKLAQMSEATRSELIQAMQASAPEPHSPDPRTPGQVAMDQARAVNRGVPQAVTGLPGAIGGGIGAIGQMLTGGGTSKGQEILRGMMSPVTTTAQGAGALIAPNSVEGPTPEEWTGAAEGAGANMGATVLAGALPRGVRTVARKIPTAAKAGAKFDAVMAKAKDIPIDTTVVQESVNRASELRKAGAPRKPSVMTAFERTQKASNTPFSDLLTYKQGRDFASEAGRQSVAETSAMSPSMKAQVKKFAKAMDDANREAAVKAGMGKLYDQSMREYSTAMTIEKAQAIAKKYAIKAGITALLGATAAGAFNAFSRE